MKQEDLEKNIQSWIDNFLNVVNPKLGNFKPCPFSGSARWRAQVGIDPLYDLLNLAQTWDDRYDVVVLGYDSSANPEMLEQVVEQINYRCLIPIDLLALEDHPDLPETVNDVVMNNRSYALILVQRFSKIAAASKSLKVQGYYKTWSPDYYNRVAGWREAYAPVGTPRSIGYLDDRATNSDPDLSSNNYPSRTQNQE